MSYSYKLVLYSKIKQIILKEQKMLVWVRVLSLLTNLEYVFHSSGKLMHMLQND